GRSQTIGHLGPGANVMNKDRQEKGWVSTVAALVVLIVVGFLCGALAGFLWEEPGLVLAYLSGKTEPVKSSDEANLGDVAAEPPRYAEHASDAGTAGVGRDPISKPEVAIEVGGTPEPVAAPAAPPEPAPTPPPPNPP